MDGRPCQTVSVTFHESFWVVTGTSAPVVTVALVVSITDVALINMRQVAAIHLRWNRTKAEDPKDWAPDLRRDAELTAITGRFRRVTWFLSASFALQTFILAALLESLSDGHNYIPPQVALWMTIAGIVSIAILQGLVNNYRVWSQQTPFSLSGTIVPVNHLEILTVERRPSAFKPGV